MIIEGDGEEGQNARVDRRKVFTFCVSGNT
jgi:hypothetical protein